MSKARAEKWPNTIDALRTRKERERLEKLQDDENQRTLLDKQTAEMVRDERRKQIEAASKRLFNQTDRVKLFNTKVEFASILKERENQVRKKRDGNHGAVHVRLLEGEATHIMLRYAHSACLCCEQIKYKQHLKMVKEQQAKDEQAAFFQTINDMDGEVMNSVQANWEKTQNAKKEKLEQLDQFSEQLLRKRMEEQRVDEMLRKKAEDDDRLGREQVGMEGFREER